MTCTLIGDLWGPAQPLHFHPCHPIIAQLLVSLALPVLSLALLCNIETSLPYTLGSPKVQGEPFPARSSLPLPGSLVYAWLPSPALPSPLLSNPTTTTMRDPVVTVYHPCREQVPHSWVSLPAKAHPVSVCLEGTGSWAPRAIHTSPRWPAGSLCWAKTKAMTLVPNEPTQIWV